MASEISALDQSEASSIEGGAAREGDGKNWGIVLGLVSAVIILGVAFAYVLSYFDIGDEYTNAEDGGGSTTTTKGDIVIPNARPRKPRKRTVRPTQGTEDTEFIEDPPAPKSYTELVCTVGADAVLESMYPDDGLCDYLYYTEIIVDTTLMTEWQDKGWLMFQTQMRSRTRTGGGIAFDINYVTPEGLRQAAVVQELEGLANRNVGHYGLLNVIAHFLELAKLLQKAQKLLEEMKTLQMNRPTGKTILAIGLYDYGLPGAWTTYTDLFVKAVNEYKADTVIAISSSVYVDSENGCQALPPSAITTIVPAFPSLELHGELVKESFMYDRSDAVVGLSYQLAVLTYQLEKETDDPEKIAYEKCTSSSHGDQEILCDEQGRHKDLSFGRVGFVTAGDNQHVFLGDDPQSVTDKAFYIKNLGVRNKFAWLVYNVHLTTLRDNLCVEPFTVLKAIRVILDLDSK